MATVTTAAQDTAGFALASNFVWSFMTGANADLARPTVIITVPAAGAGIVATNTAISATFSEDMNPATISGTSFTVANTTLGTAVAGTESYSAASRTAVFTPTTPSILADNTLFTATITSGAADLAGNTLAINHAWTFTTAAVADATRPTVILTVPSAGAADVPNNTQITATFSEDMNAVTISGTSFTLTNTTLGSAVAGNVSYSVAARTATFTPTTPLTLASNALFSATITTAATDLAGNALAGNSAVLPNSGNHAWTFTTAATGDVTAPTVTSISPLDGTNTVCLTKTVSATFSEPMDAATINTTTFTVTDTGVAVAGSVTYDAANQTASFVPTAAAGFAASTSFAVTLLSGSAGMKDLAGNPLAVNRVWGFTTGTLPCAGGVNLRSAASFGAFGGAAGVTNQGINTVVNGNLGTTAACTLMTGFTTPSMSTPRRRSTSALSTAASSARRPRLEPQ